MNAKWLPSRRSFLAGLLGISVLLVAAALTHADQGKWWTPRERDSQRIVRERFSQRWDRGPRWDRGWRRGGPVVRDVVIIREGARGPFFRARRCYAQPVICRRVVFVRPVRYFVSAD